MTTSALLSMVDAFEVVDLGRPFFTGMPQSPNHAEFRLSSTRRHGDMVREDGGSAAADLVVSGLHVGTHIDALAHVSHCGALHGDADAATEQVAWAFSSHGIHTVEPFLCRGLLLDVPYARGTDRCTPGEELSPRDLLDALEAAQLETRPGDALLVRTGWGQLWPESAAYVGRDSGVPGPGEGAARWLADRAPSVVGADTIAFERIAPGRGHAVLPAHRVLLVEHGINIIETLDLETLAARGVREFLFVAIPLRIEGATASPIRPLAVVAR